MILAVSRMGRLPRPRPLPQLAAAGKMALAIVFVFPLAWMMLSSLRPVAEIFQYIFPFSLWTVVPVHPTLESYRHLFRDEPFGRYLVNSLIVASCVAVLDVAVSSMAAYAFARIPGKRAVLLFGAGRDDRSV
jgi:multiple sugar transport system permease protein